jgi:hypothetical protein
MAEGWREVMREQRTVLDARVSRDSGMQGELGSSGGSVSRNILLEKGFTVCIRWHESAMRLSCVCCSCCMPHASGLGLISKLNREAVQTTSSSLRTLREALNPTRERVIGRPSWPGNRNK